MWLEVAVRLMCLEISRDGKGREAYHKPFPLEVLDINAYWGRHDV
jgi:hypothetical protein